MKTLFAIAALLCTGSACAADTVWVGKADCRIAENSRVTGQSPDWNGACKDGYASGPGALQWSKDGKETERYEGNLSKGVPDGAGIAQWADGSLHEGTYREGKLHGAATVVFSSKSQLRGTFEQGRVVGDVKFDDQSGSLYEGGWGDDGPEGRGTKVFALGGSYRGLWHKGKPVGDGEILYPNGQVLKGSFNGSFLLKGQEATPAELAKRYEVKHKQPPTGSHLAEVAASGYFVPPEKPYAGLTPEQQRAVKSFYHILQEDDVPPYPANGNGELSRHLSALIPRMDKFGHVKANVSVDEKGVPQSVALLSMPSPQSGELVASMLMLIKYTPGSCAGQPCAMAVPFSYLLDN